VVEPDGTGSFRIENLSGSSEVAFFLPSRKVDSSDYYERDDDGKGDDEDGYYRPLVVGGG
jgi:hypothetical protein